MKPWTCQKCRAMVFVSAGLHAFLCKQYIRNAKLVGDSHRVFERFKVFFLSEKPS